MKPLSSSAQKIQDILRLIHPKYTVMEFDESTRTAQEAAERVGCQLGQIIKTLVFKTEKSGRSIIVLASGANRVDEARLGKLVGEPIVRPDADFVRTATGFAIGGVPPLGYPQPIETYIDEDLLQYTEVWAAAGAPRAVFQCNPSDLLQFTGGKVAAVKQS